MKRRLSSGILSGGVKVGVGTIGAVIETGRVMAEGNADPGSIIGAVSTGKDVAIGLATPVTFGLNKLEQVSRGIKGARAIDSGRMDKTLGINDIPRPNMPDPVLGEAGGGTSRDYDSMMDSQKEIYRKALAKYYAMSAIFGKNAGEIAYYKH